MKKLIPHAPQFDDLADTGLIGVLSGHVPVSFAPALVDALLAAPVLITVVQLDGPYALDLLADLRQQAGNLMLVGVAVPHREALLEGATAVDLALQAGAQFCIAPPMLATGLRLHHIPAVPQVRTLPELEQAAQNGWPLVQVEKLSPPTVLAWHTAVGQPHLIVHTDPASLKEVTAYRLAGATALAVPLWQMGQDTIRPSIVKARTLSDAWQAAANGHQS